MALIHDTVTKDLIVNTVCGQLNGGATIQFLTSGSTVVAVINLDSTAFSTSSSGQANALSFPKTATAIAAGTITQFQIVDSLSVVKITGTVTIEGSGGDIELTSIIYAINDTVTLSSLIYRVPN